MTPTTCPALAALLEQAGGCGDDELARRIAAHVDTCRDCQRAETLLQSLLARYRRLACSPLPEEVEQRLLRRLTRRRHP